MKAKPELFFLRNPRASPPDGVGDGDDGEPSCKRSKQGLLHQVDEGDKGNENEQFRCDDGRWCKRCRRGVSGAIAQAVEHDVPAIDGMHDLGRNFITAGIDWQFDFVKVRNESIKTKQKRKTTGWAADRSAKSTGQQ